MARRRGRSVVALVVVVVASGWAVSTARGQNPRPGPELRLFFEATAEDQDQAQAALARLSEAWQPGYTGIIWDMLRFMVPPTRPAPPSFGAPGDVAGSPIPLVPPEHPTTRVWRRFIRFIEAQTDLRLGRGYDDLPVIQRWMWDQPYTPHPDYATFKGVWYGRIDPAFQAFFGDGTRSTVRLDEIDWGGVPVNGIPPLEYPVHVAAGVEAARYLDDDDVVFGVAVRGAFRAYPKRILAWHEMALDRLGDLELTVVYCTLCGTVIPYESVVDGRHLRFGTSGLLYRSNKLMFDHATRSLWNTFEGVPIVGPLVGSGLRLRHRSVVTTTWGEWRRIHPETTVLSLDTGYERDYREGVAYRDYFATDRLMFEVSHRDDRLDNKDEVVVWLPEDAAGERRPLAISVDLLEDRPVFEIEHAGLRYLVVTSRGGANRVYETGGRRFRSVGDDDRLGSDDGSTWRVTEEYLELEPGPDDIVPGSSRLPRVAAQRAFWFGWVAQFPETRLVK